MISIVSLRRRSRFRFLLVGMWITSLVAAFLAGAIVFRQRHQIRKLIGTAIRGRVIESNLYNIAVKTLPIPGGGRDGGIDALDDGLLLANRFGAMWFVTSARELRPLSLKIPVNFEEFDHDPYNKTTACATSSGSRTFWSSGLRAEFVCWLRTTIGTQTNIVTCFAFRVWKQPPAKSGAEPTRFSQVGGRCSRLRRACPLRVCAAFTSRRKMLVDDSSPCRTVRSCLA